MESFLAQFVATIVLGVFLVFAYKCYELVKSKINNWKQLLLLCILSYLIAFGSTVVLPKETIFSTVTFFAFFVLANILCFMTLFMYGESKKNNKL